MKTISTDRRRMFARKFKPKRPPEAVKQNLPGSAAEKPVAKALETLFNQKLKASKHLLPIRVFLLDVGIPPHRIGLFSDAIDLGYRRPETLKKVTKTIYPVVAKKNDITAANVEHTMRRALEKCCKNGSIQNLDRILHVSAFTGAKSIRTKDFLYLIVDHLRSVYGPYREDSGEDEAIDESFLAEL